MNTGIRPWQAPPQESRVPAPAPWRKDNPAMTPFAATHLKFKPVACAAADMNHGENTRGSPGWFARQLSTRDGLPDLWAATLERGLPGRTDDHHSAGRRGPGGGGAATSVSSESPLKILVMVREFLPSVGGIQSATDVLVRELLRRGSEIVVVTNTEDAADRAYSCRVVRKPSVVALWKLCAQADIVYQSGLSLRWILPPLLIGKPIIITHHMLLVGNPLICAMKRALAKRVVTVAVSRFMAVEYRGANFVVGNPYDDKVFANRNYAERDQDCVFVGRLIREKGADVAIRAISRLKRDGKHARLTIVGRGPQEDELRALAHRIGVEGLVSFAGWATGAALSELLNRHKLALIPSRWDEPFGLVALEAIACGCAPIASRIGGLPEALGPCGLLVPPDDVDALAKAIGDHLDNRSQRDALLDAASTHLASHSSGAIALEYLAIMTKRVGCHLIAQ